MKKVDEGLRLLEETVVLVVNEPTDQNVENNIFILR